MKSLGIVQLALLLSITGCTLAQSPISAVEDIAVPDGRYRLEEVMPSGKLLLSDSLDFQGDKIERYVILDNRDMYPLSLPQDESCLTGTFYNTPTMLPDGRLGFIKFCVKSMEEPLGKRGEHSLVALDLEQGTLEPIMVEPLYDEIQGYFTWNPDMSKGIIGDADLYGTLHWISPESPEPMDIILGEGNLSWSLADALSILTSGKLLDGSLNQIGRAEGPAWSPDGNTIAFVASPEAITYEGIFRTQAPFHLYLMDSTELMPRAVLDNIFNPTRVKWSPNSQVLLIDACIGDPTRCGLWMYSPHMDRLDLVAPGELFYGAGWLSEDIIVAGYCIEEVNSACSRYTIRKYHLKR